MHTAVHLLVLFSFLRESLACPNPSTYAFAHGLINGTILSDGPIIFASNPFKVPFRAVRDALIANFRVPDLRYGQNVAVLDTPSGRLLIDAGSANLRLPMFRKAGGLFRNLDAAAITPASVDRVLLSHGHVDHVAGLVTKIGDMAFPNAVVYIGEVEHRYWSANSTLTAPETSEAAQLYVSSVAPYASVGRLKLVKKNAAPFRGVRFLFVPGHSPGHNAIQVKFGRKRLVLSGDAWGTQADSLQNPEWGFLFDTDSREASKNRVRLLNIVARRRDLVLSYHENFPGLGYVKRAVGSFDWVPAPPQKLGIGVKRTC